MHSEYCPLCVLPYERPFAEAPDRDDDMYPVYRKLQNIDFAWLENGLAFDRDTHTIFPVEGDDGHAQFPIKGRPEDLFTSEMTVGNDGDAGWGPVYHEECIQYLSDQLKRQFTYEDGIEIFKLVEYRRNEYGGQYYEWAEALEEEGVAYFYSPLNAKGKKTRDRITHPLAAWISRQKLLASPTGSKRLQRDEAAKELARVQAELKQALARVDELRQQVATREAALAALGDSPKKVQKTRKVAKAPASVVAPMQASVAVAMPMQASVVAPMQASVVAPMAASVQVHCPSHKSKEDCPPTHCVWGKTGKCSKKRSHSGKSD
jgi:flagellar motility protein MotE (MotC chaperone)